MQKFKVADGGNPDGTAKDGEVGVTAGTKYKAGVYNDNIFNLFEFVENQGYSLIDDDLEQITKAARGKYNPLFTYNTSSIATQTVNDVVMGSDGILYEAQANAISGDDPVGSVTGNWSEYIQKAPTAPNGTNTTQLATTAFAFGLASKGLNGYIKLPNGVIIQWLTTTQVVTAGADTGTLLVALPISFPNAHLQVLMSTKNLQSGNLEATRATTNSISQLSFGLKSTTSQTITLTFLSIGY